MMKQMAGVRNRMLIVGALVLASSIPPAFANGFHNPPPGAEALALDGGKSVLVEDVTGLAANPALLSGLDHPEAAASITLIDAETSFTSATGVKSTTRSNLKTLPNLFAAVPVRDNLVFGLGVTTPYGQSVEWSPGSGLPYFTELRLVDISPALSVRLLNRIAAGVALDIYVSDFTSKQSIPWSTILGNPLLPYGSASLEGDGNAVGATAGMVLDITGAQRVSLVYRSSFRMEYEGDVTLSGTPAPVAAAIPAKSYFETEIEFPTIAVAGYALDLTDRLTVAAEVEWIEFSRFESLPVDVGGLQPFGIFPSALPQQWEDIWTYGAAARLKCTDELELRCSYRFLESPIPESTQAPSLPDADKHVIGIGAGWNSGRIGLSAGYAYTIFEDREITIADNPVFPGKYDLSSHIVSASLRVSL